MQKCIGGQEISQERETLLREYDFWKLGARELGTFS